MDNRKEREMIYFVRHGESEANKNMSEGGLFSFEEHYDAPLTEKGKEQARETAEVLKDKSIDIVVTSGLLRAIETGKIINGKHEAPMLEMVDLNEREDRREGVGDGMKGWNESFDFDYDANPSIEKLEEFKDRVVRAIEEIKVKYGDKDVLVVAHGGVSHVFRRYFSGRPWEGNIREVKMKNAEVVSFEFEEENK